MNYKRLYDDMTEIVAEALQYFERMDTATGLMSFDDVEDAIKVSIERYRSDPRFRAKVQSLVGRLTGAVQRQDVPNAELTRLDAAGGQSGEPKANES